MRDKTFFEEKNQINEEEAKLSKAGNNARDFTVIRREVSRLKIHPRIV